MRSLEDADKNGWTVVYFSAMVVTIDLGPQQIGSPTMHRRHFENCFATVPLAVPWPYFREDKARSRVAIKCLTACQTLPWPARLPDLSSIEHVLDMMKRRLHLL
ncbi:hypothetical protein TNCV_3876881 [Trichonephila clavipes]|uniref:Uncharacterized protein n=1 Tax=Trichonephila clavipes TaxID=2585209 RepID=A0A8X6SW98_TRICX|nr:hypothetical protein TNCV_3876881 [Trichonephila clavipes]